MSILSKLQSLLTAANATTGESDTTLTDAMQTLVDGYGQGGGGEDYLLKKIIDQASSYTANCGNNEITSRAFDGWSQLTGVHLTNCGKIGSYAFNSCSGLTAAVIVGTSALTFSNGNVFSGCSSLEVADFSVPSDANIGGSYFSGSTTNLNKLILRSPSVVALNNINVFSVTKFKDGGTGGTLYVPSSLISSYQSANNWSTILGYTNNSIQAIEGSQYENYYADGTPIT